MAWFLNFIKRTDQIGQIKQTSLASTLSLWAFLFFIFINVAVFASDVIFMRPISQTTSGFLTTTTTAGLIPSMLYIFGGAMGYCSELKHKNQTGKDSSKAGDRDE